MYENYTVKNTVTRRVSRNSQEGGAQNLKAFFFCFSIFQGGGGSPETS